MRDANDFLREEGGEALRGRFDEARQHRNGKDRGPHRDWPEPDMTILAKRRQQPAAALNLSLFGSVAPLIQAIAEYKGAPIDAAALALLTSASALVGAKRRAQPWSGYSEPSILWGGLVMAPSQNKSPVLDPFRDAMHAAEKSLMADHDDRRRKHEAKKIEAEAARTKWEKDVREAIDKGYPTPPLPLAADPPPEPYAPRFWVGDITMEKAARLMAAQPGGLLVYRDELAGWIASFGRYSGSSADRHFWKECFGGRPLRFDRVGGGEIEIPYAAASVIGAIPPESVHSLVLTGEQDGFAARFDWVWPDPVPPKRPSADPFDAIQKQLNQIFERLATLGMDSDHFNKPKPRDLPLEREAANDFDTWRIIHYVERHGITGLYADALGKQPGKVLRIASMLEHLWWAASARNNEPAEISCESVHNAMALIDGWVTPHLQRVLGEAIIPKADHGAAALARWLVKQDGRTFRTFNASHVRRNENLPGLASGPEMDEACSELVNAKWIQRIGATTAKGGAPKKEFEVNPRVFAKEHRAI